MEPVRLNKYLSDVGVCSRREADRLLEEGRLRVNGLRPELGQKVTDRDVITVNGREISAEAPEKVIIAVNKPVGVVCTTKAFPGEENIVNLVDFDSRLYPVGRLDKDSQGLIFLTNDGDFAAEVTKASGHHEKEYEVTVNKDITDNFLKRLGKGMYLKDLDRNTAACEVRKSGNRSFKIILTQGMNRQIRRMCETCGYEVRTLKRVRIMNVQLGDLEEGTWRRVNGEELRTLLASVKEPAPKKKAAEKSSGEKKAGASDKKSGGAAKSSFASEQKSGERKSGEKKSAGFGKSTAKKSGFGPARSSEKKSSAKTGSAKTGSAKTGFGRKAAEEEEYTTRKPGSGTGYGRRTGAGKGSGTGGSKYFGNRKNTK